MEIKILDLFAGTQSVRKAFPNCDYKGIDIYSPEGENIILDLTQENIVDKLVEKLGDWKPHIIWASPVCNKFSRVITGEGGNYYFEVENGNIKPRENWDIKVQPHMKKYQNKYGHDKARQESLTALKMFQNTKRIINYFKVPFALENPTNALSVYLLKKYEKNNCNYCMYDFDYKKPTTIYSHKKLNLLKCDHSGPHKKNISSNIGKYSERSAVPPKLIKDVIDQLLEGGRWKWN